MIGTDLVAETYEEACNAKLFLETRFDRFDGLVAGHYREQYGADHIPNDLAPYDGPDVTQAEFLNATRETARHLKYADDLLREIQHAIHYLDAGSAHQTYQVYDERVRAGTLRDQLYEIEQVYGRLTERMHVRFRALQSDPLIQVNPIKEWQQAAITP